MTASESASKIAESRSRSSRRALNVWRSAPLIVSSARPRSVISSRPPAPSSGSSRSPSLIRAALSASRLTRDVIALAIRNETRTATRTATPSAVRRSPRSDSIASCTSGARWERPRSAPSMVPSRKIGTATTVTPPGSSST